MAIWYVVADDTATVAVVWPPVPPRAPEPPAPPAAPWRSKLADVTPAGGVQVPEPTVQVTVTVVVPASVQVPVTAAWAGVVSRARPTSVDATSAAIADSVSASRGAR
jgi:hypothetical protein